MTLFSVKSDFPTSSVLLFSIFNFDLHFSKIFLNLQKFHFARSATGSEKACSRRKTLSRRGRGQRPKAGVIQGYIEAVAMVCIQFTDKNDKDDYHDLHVQWVELLE